MINENRIGRKSDGGFYRVKKSGELKVKEVIDLTSMNYREVVTEFEDFVDIETIINKKDSLGMAFREILIEFGSYISSLVPEVTSNFQDIDLAMKMGYSWKYGPFEMINGITSLSNDLPRLREIVGAPSVRNDHSSKSAPLDLGVNKLVFENKSASLLDVNDNLCISINTKMCSLDHYVFEMIIKATEYAQKMSSALYIYNGAANFSVGADLRVLLELIDRNAFDEILDFIKLGQDAMLAMKYSKTPVISAAKGFALGGGCEILMHSDIVVANQQINAGLAEVGVGLLPGWGGLKEVVLRSKGDHDTLVSYLESIVMQKRTTSSDYLVEYYGIKAECNMNVDYLFHDAVNLSHSKSQKVHEVSIPAFDLFAKLKAESLDDHTRFIVGMLNSLSGKSMSERDLLAFEQDSFIALISTEVAQQKIRSIIKR
jgi:3-hydroxyacyl-CoA dehydrogenase/enoyl-CoA hydratase/3-hydroxybutyryl-CoA epimerase